LTPAFTDTGTRANLLICTKAIPWQAAACPLAQDAVAREEVALTVSPMSVQTPSYK